MERKTSVLTVLRYRKPSHRANLFPANRWLRQRREYLPVLRRFAAGFWIGVDLPEMPS